MSYVYFRGDCSIKPISLNAAREFIDSVHRHLSSPNGWLFGVGLYKSDTLVGVGCCARPVARLYQDGLTCEICRIATDGTYNACSALYAPLMRAAKALGYTRIITYTRFDEPGTSPKAAGFRFDGHSKGGEWDRKSRTRNYADDPARKVRWVWLTDERRRKEWLELYTIRNGELK